MFGRVTTKRVTIFNRIDYNNEPNFLLQISLPYSKYSLRCTNVFCSSFSELIEINRLPPSQANVVGLSFKRLLTCPHENQLEILLFGFGNSNFIFNRYKLSKILLAEIVLKHDFYNNYKKKLTFFLNNLGCWHYRLQEQYLHIKVHG